LVAHDNAVQTIRYGSDVFATTDGKVVRIWNKKTRSKEHEIDPKFEIRGMRFSPRSDWLAVHGFEDVGGVLRLYDTSAFESEQPIRTQKPVQDVAFSPDFRFVATATAPHRRSRLGGTGTGKVTTWRIEDGAKQIEFAVLGHFVAWSHDGKTIAAGDGAKVRLLDLTERTHFPINDVTPRTRFSRIPGVAMSPTDSVLAYGATRNTRRLSWAVELKRLDDKPWTAIHRGMGGYDWMRNLMFTHNGGWVAALGGDGLHLLEVTTGKQHTYRIARNNDSGTFPVSFSISRDVEEVAIGRDNGTVRFVKFADIVEQK